MGNGFYPLEMSPEPHEKTPRSVSYLGTLGSPYKFLSPLLLGKK